MTSKDSLAVLYVDDDRSRAATVAEELQRAAPGITVQTATTRADAAADAVACVDCVVAPCASDGTSESLFDALRADHPNRPFVLFAAADECDDRGEPGERAYGRLARRIRKTVADNEQGLRDTAAPSQSRNSPTAAGDVDPAPEADADADANREVQRYGAAFERARDAMIVADDDGACVEVNAGACDLFGLSREDLLGRHVDEFVPEDYGFEVDWLALETEATATGTFPAVRPDGERRLVEYAATANIVPGEHLAVLRDVTERTRLRDALETEQAALGEMYRITADREASFESKVRRLLDLGCDLLDVPYGFLTEIDGGTQTIVTARGDHPLLQSGESCPLSEAYCRKTITRPELVTVQNAAAEGWSDDVAYERFGLGCYVGAEITVEDDTYGTFCFAGPDSRTEPFSETERTFVELMARWTSYELEQQFATERLQRQNKRLEEFASMVSHDLRSPLNVACGYLDLVRDDGDPEQFDRIEHAHDRIERIISDVLYLAREGEEIGSTEPVDLADAARTSWDVIATASRDATLTVESGVGSVCGDPDRLCQLLENLFRNAVEHGGNAVAVRVEPTAGGFAVEDDGPGIPADERDGVFERGYTTNEDGTGFGLYIVRNIAEAHGWTVAVTDGADGGARFEVGDVAHASDC
jgi:PAS domain S-box-containing protein